MTVQTSDALANAMIGQYETTVGASAKVQLRTGAPPANCAAADTGTLLAELTLPADWLTAAASRAVTLNGSWSGTASAAGTVGHYRLKNNAGSTTHEQGTAGQSVSINTSATTAANGNVLTFASTTGVAVGQNIGGTGVVAGAQVIAFTGTTVTMSLSSTAGVGSAASITFSNDLTIDNAVLAISQVVNVTAWSRTQGGA